MSICYMWRLLKWLCRRPSYYIELPCTFLFFLRNSVLWVWDEKHINIMARKCRNSHMTISPGSNDEMTSSWRLHAVPANQRSARAGFSLTRMPDDHFSTVFSKQCKHVKKSLIRVTFSKWYTLPILKHTLQSNHNQIIIWLNFWNHRPRKF